MDLDNSNLVKVSGLKDLIRDFTFEDLVNLTPVLTEEQTYLNPHHHVRPESGMDVSVYMYATDDGIIQLTNYGLTVTMLLTIAQRQAHLLALQSEIGIDGTGNPSA